MSWSPLPPAGKPAGAAIAAVRLSLVTSKRYRPALLVVVRPRDLAGLAFLAKGQRCRALLGDGPDAGLLRVEPGEDVPCGGLLGDRTASFVSLRLSVPPGVVAAQHPLQPVEFDFDAKWLCITLPAWARPPGAEPRGVALAREAAEIARGKLVRRA